MSATFWLSYGGGVNSTALAVILATGKLPQYTPFRIVFADTGNEKDETYEYIEKHFVPWLGARGLRLEVVRPAETVLERWQRLRVTGSRITRSCTEHAKVKPIAKYVASNGGGTLLIGIDADESHRSPHHVRPLVDLNIGRDDCIRIIIAAGLKVPPKSGCWHCPFMRVSEVLDLARKHPDRLDVIDRLEQEATKAHGTDPYNRPRTQWHDKPVAYWRVRASQRHLQIEDDSAQSEPPCGCYDG